jgi:hypothetical protein
MHTTVHQFRVVANAIDQDFYATHLPPPPRAILDRPQFHHEPQDQVYTSELPTQKNDHGEGLEKSLQPRRLKRKLLLGMSGRASKGNN